MEKHTAANIRAGGGFVVNLVNAELAQAMNITAADFDLGIDELAMAGLSAAPSAHVAPPRIAEAPVALECTVLQITDLPGGAMIVLGQVQALHIDETKMLDVERCWVDTPRWT
ncbi:flavin reductase family protein [Pseudoroseomonas wenyumeiae]